MSNVDNATRSGFFPNAKTPSQSKRTAKLNQALLKRNDISKTKEIETLTKQDAKVMIPDAIKDFSRIKRAVDSSAEVDNNAKIMELKQQIKNGTYKVDHEKLADKILSSEF